MQESKHGATTATESTEDPASRRQPILQEGETCWRIARAERAALLVDGAAYFEALRAAPVQPG